jgi:hypothetical protein
MRIPVHRRSPLQRYYGPGTMIESETRLYDLETDPGQLRPLQDPATEARMIGLLRELMAANHAPDEAYERLRIDPPRDRG